MKLSASSDSAYKEALYLLELHAGSALVMKRQKGLNPPITRQPGVTLVMIGRSQYEP